MRLVVSYFVFSFSAKAEPLVYSIGGATPTFSGWPNLQRRFHVLRTIPYTTTFRLGTDRNHCVMCVKFSNA